MNISEMKAVLKKCIWISVVIATVNSGYAQYGLDVGIIAGGANYLGEFGGKAGERRDFIADMKMSQTRWAVGAFGRYKLTNNLAVNAGYKWIRIQGADNLSDNPSRVGRNLDFKNNIHELEARGEYYWYKVNDVGRRGWYRMDFQTYIFAGIAGFMHNPQAIDGTKLMPLQTEGVKYGKFQVALPIGAGLFYTYKKIHRFGLDFGLRFTWTDYLDDASTIYVDHNSPYANRYQDGLSTVDPSQYQPGSPRGNPKKDDFYTYTAFYYSRVMKTKNSFYRQKYNYVYGGKRKRRRTRAKF